MDIMLVSALVFTALAVATPSPYIHHDRRQVVNSTAATFTENSIEVDLGYSVYKGWHNDSASLNIFQG